MRAQQGIRAGALSAAVLCTTLTWGAAPAVAAESTRLGWEAQAISLPAAHKVTLGEGATVAVLDSGVNADHPALKGRVQVGPSFYDEDGQGPGDKDYGHHGTAMASDVLKIAPKAKVITARVINDSKDEKLIRTKNGASPLALGIDWAVEQSADVISMSLGGGTFSDLEDSETAAAARAVQKGVTLLAGAGNSADEGNEGNFPTGYATVISVAATKPGGGHAEFSTVRTHNHIAAPGVDIVSARYEGGYKSIQGTSPATAIAAGVTALMVSENPDLTPAEVKKVLMQTAAHPAGGHDPLLGAGQVNAAAAVRAAKNPPKVDVSPKEYSGDKKTFGTPSGMSKVDHPEIEQELVTIGGGAAGVGLLMVIGGVLLFRRKKQGAGVVR